MKSICSCTLFSGRRCKWIIHTQRKSSEKEIWSIDGRTWRVESALCVPSKKSYAFAEFGQNNETVKLRPTMIDYVFDFEHVACQLYWIFCIISRKQISRVVRGTQKKIREEQRCWKVGTILKRLKIFHLNAFHYTRLHLRFGWRWKAVALFMFQICCSCQKVAG